MKKRKNILYRFLRLMYLKLFRIHDSAQRISLGVGLGVFLGIMPGTGPLAALFLAFIFRANRAAALIGSLLINTWFSILTFLLSVKIGSVIMNLRWQDVYDQWQLFLKDFSWKILFKSSVFKIILPVLIGYLVIAFCIGLLTYLVALLILSRIKHAQKNRIDLSGQA